MKYPLTIITCFVLSFGNINEVAGQHVGNYSLTFISDQTTPKLREYALYYYEIADYLNALPLYEELSDRFDDNPEYLYRTGVCYLFVPNGPQYAIGYLEKVRIINPEKKELALTLAIAYHGNHEFDKATRFYNNALKEKKSSAEKANIERRIQACATGKELKENFLNVEILNMGEPINSRSTEYIPLLSADESTLIFTYNYKDTAKIEKLGEISVSYDDIYISTKTEGVWSKPKSIGDNINNPNMDEAAVGVSADGKQIFILMFSEISSGDIYSSKLDSGVWTIPVMLRGEVNTDSWEGGASISPDGKVLYFDSERKGGFGGSDIYKALLQDDGSWGDVTNLGSTINSPYNDEAAFIHSDNKTLFFSSEGHQTMGSFDIFRSTQANGTWETPQNLGYPINSAGSDKYFVSSSDGKRGYYHQDKTNGYGEKDLYMIDFEPGKDSLDMAQTSTGDPNGIGSSSPYSKPVTISGSLLNTTITNRALSNVKVQLFGDEGRALAQTTSDKDGKFEFTNIGGHDKYDLEITFDDIQQVATNAAVADEQVKSKTTTDSEPGSGQKIDKVFVQNNAVCTKIVNMEPTGEVSEVTSDIGKLWFFTEVKSPVGVEDYILHKWYFMGKEVATVTLKVKGPRWRTYSSKNIERGVKGDWKVEAVDSNGAILATKEFKVK